jgi:hypothetical protein
MRHNGAQEGGGGGNDASSIDDDKTAVPVECHRPAYKAHTLLLLS